MADLKFLESEDLAALVKPLKMPVRLQVLVELRRHKDDLSKAGKEANESKGKVGKETDEFKGIAEAEEFKGKVGKEADEFKGRVVKETDELKGLVDGDHRATPVWRAGVGSSRNSVNVSESSSRNSVNVSEQIKKWLLDFKVDQSPFGRADKDTAAVFKPKSFTSDMLLLGRKWRGNDDQVHCAQFLKLCRHHLQIYCYTRRQTLLWIFFNLEEGLVRIAKELISRVDQCIDDNVDEERRSNCLLECLHGFLLKEHFDVRGRNRAAHRLR